jgi:hypothetical protein
MQDSILNFASAPTHQDLQFWLRLDSEKGSRTIERKNQPKPKFNQK